jgi:hypothetical protein
VFANFLDLAQKGHLQASSPGNPTFFGSSYPMHSLRES